MEPGYSPKEIITIILLTVLFVGIPLGVYLVSKQTNLFSSAAISREPRDVRISNITDASFTISWTDNKKSYGFIKYGLSEKPETTIFDDRDSNVREERLTHHITPKNLESGRNYYFQIRGVKKVYKQETLQSLSKQFKTISGKIAKADKTPPSEALVYLKKENSLFSTFIKPNGTFSIGFFGAYEETDKIEVNVWAGKDGLSRLITTLDNPQALSNIIVR